MMLSKHLRWLQVLCRKVLHVSFIPVLSLLLCYGPEASGQESGKTSEGLEVEEKDKRHAISFTTGYSLLPIEGRDGERIRRLIPSFEVGYGFSITRWWALGLKVEVEIDSYILARNDKEDIERDFPVLIGLQTGFRLYEGLVFKLGGGIEVERNENLGYYQFGLEYAFELPKNWEIGPELLFLVKDNEAGGGSFGVFFAKLF